MTEKPILFSGEMVRAILDGRKTQTRRVIRLPESAEVDREKGTYSWAECGYSGQDLPLPKSPYGSPGDRLWVRETWRVGAWMHDSGSIAVDYCADGLARTEWLDVPDSDMFERFVAQSLDDAEKALGLQERYVWQPGNSPLRWRPSIHMPRWASRITLEVTGVRVERLQEISEEDARAEGFKTKNCQYSLDEPCRHCRPCPANIIAQFKVLWESINAKRPGCSWEDNPWVFVVEFKRLEK